MILKYIMKEQTNKQTHERVYCALTIVVCLSALLQDLHTE